VLAEVENTTGIDNEPPVRLLHVFITDPTPAGGCASRCGNGTTAPSRYWIVRSTGRGAWYDAIDAQAFNTDSEDDYRAMGGDSVSDQ
jgi:hypothetical protein